MKTIYYKGRYDEDGDKQCHNICFFCIYCDSICVNFPAVKTDNFVVTLDAYQKQVYQISIDTGEVASIPLAKPYKGVAIDLNKFTNQIYWSDNQVPAIMTSYIDGFDERVFRKLPNGIYTGI